MESVTRSPLRRAAAGLGAFALAMGAWTPAFAAESSTDTASQLETYCIAACVVVGILALAGVVLLIVRRKKLVGTHRKVLTVVCAILAVLFVVLAIVANVMTNKYASSLDAVFTKAASYQVTSTQVAAGASTTKLA